MFRYLPQRGRGFRGSFLLATFLLGAVAALASDQPASLEGLWKKLEPFAQPPEEFAGKFGSYRSPLQFADGTVAKTATDWARRREDILKTWHKRLGEGGWTAISSFPGDQDRFLPCLSRSTSR
jgi:hypothetical protein